MYKNKVEKREYEKKWKLENPQKVKESSKKWNNSDKRKKYLENWNNSEKGKESIKKARIKFSLKEDKKPRTEYSRIWHLKNKERIRPLQKKWRDDNPEKTKEQYRRSDLKKKFGITVLEFDELFKKQNGVCKICLNPETSTRGGNKRNISVDHDHKTGKIRGLLCNNCNRAMGLFKDDIKILIRVIDYLKGNL